MPRYIDADAFVGRYRELYCTDCNYRKNEYGRIVYNIGEVVCKSCGINDVLNALDDTPTADVAEVKHGKNLNQYKADTLIICSECGINLKGHCTERKIMYSNIGVGVEYGDKFEVKYCPNCGAKMDGE